jgi:hypothetical protein
LLLHPILTDRVLSKTAATVVRMHCTPSPNYTHRLNIKKITALCITNKNHPDPENTHHVCADLKEKIPKKDHQ